MIREGRGVPAVENPVIRCGECKDKGYVLTEYGQKVRTLLLADVQELIDQVWREVGLPRNGDELDDVFEPVN